MAAQECESESAGLAAAKKDATLLGQDLTKLYSQMKAAALDSGFCQANGCTADQVRTMYSRHGYGCVYRQFYRRVCRNDMCTGSFIGVCVCKHV